MTETDFQTRVVDLAHMFGWRVAHFRAARTDKGWRTPVAADGAGYPDLHLLHTGRGVSMFRELKTGRGQLSSEQQRWGEWLTTCGQDWGVWRPADWDQIVAVLSHTRACTTL